MIGVKSCFSNEELLELQKIEVALSDSHDYSDGELLELHEQITENFPYVYDDDGSPKQLGSMFEHIIDVFYDQFQI